MSRFVMALDQGTTSSRAILFDREGQVAALDQHEFPQHFPKPGWVEHDPGEIWESQLRAARGALGKAGARAEDVAAIGITNQRETTVVWDRASGEPIHRAIVWQSRQTAPICEALRARGLADEVRRRTGLVIDAYFSATKIRFILDAVPGAQARAERGELAFGTIDSWLVHKLTKGRVHATEYSNASRTMLYDIVRRDWDELLLGELRIPREMLPAVHDSSGVLGATDREWFGGSLPIAGVAGDQQAALFGQGCFAPGGTKNTYGTGCFLLMNTGAKPVESKSGLVTTLAWGLGGRVDYALEGSVFVAGAALQWLRDGLGLVKNAAESEAAARSVPDTGDVYLVPAFVGLGAPHWDERARGAIVGLTRGTTREHVIRAALESIAYQTLDVMECLHADSGLRPERLRVDGGASGNAFLMQFQADLLGIPVFRPKVLEVTALGAAALAGLAVGFWRDRSELEATTAQGGTTFDPAMSAGQRDRLSAGWKRAVERAKGLGHRMKQALVIAHRGASAERPENTLAAFELAVEQRADMIETDLHRTCDGAIVIIHDEDLAGLGGRGEVADATLAELRALDAGGGEPVPTLEEILDRFGPRIPFNLEIKRGTRGEYPGLEAAALASVEQRGLLDRTLFSSFYDPVLRRVRELSASARIGFLVSRRFPDRAVERARAVGAEALHPELPLVTRSLVDEAHDAGLAVYVFTVDAPADMQRLLDLGVDGLFTNHPDRMRGLLKSSSPRG